MKTSSILNLFVVACIFVAFMACSKEDAEEPRYKSEDTITVLLREDLKPGNDLMLPVGHFYTNEAIIVENYKGTVSGAGIDKTIIEVAQGFKALPDPYVNQSGTEIASLFSMYWPTGDVTFKDITFLIKGEAPALAHNNPFAGTKTTIDNVIVVTGGVDSAITVTFKNIQIIGELSSDAGASKGCNLMWPLIAAGMNDRYSIDLVAENCEIVNCGNVGLEYWNAHGGSGEINNNRFENCYNGIWLGWGMAASTVNIKNNDFVNNSIPISNNSGCPACCMNNTRNGEPMADDCK